MIKKSGIYKILNHLNSDCYIGQTINFRERQYRHFHELDKNGHKHIDKQEQNTI